MKKLHLEILRIRDLRGYYFKVERRINGTRHVKYFACKGAMSEVKRLAA